MDLVKKFQELDIDDELVKPLYIVSIGNLEGKIKKAMEDDSESSSHESNLDYRKQSSEQIQKIMKDQTIMQNSLKMSHNL